MTSHAAPTPSHSSSVSPSSSFHPHLLTSLTSLLPLSASPSCSLHVLYTLSSSVILDPYQLQQLHSEGRLVTASQPSLADDPAETKRQPVQAELWLGGQFDLEAPVSKIDREQNTYLLVTLPIISGSNSSSTANATAVLPVSSVDVHLDLPLHLRYQEPALSRYLGSSNLAGFFSGWGGGSGPYGGKWWTKDPLPDNRQDLVQVPIEWPCIFWKCDDEQVQLASDSPYLRMSESSSCARFLPSNSPLSSHSSSSSTHYLLPSHQPSPGSGNTQQPSSAVTVPTGVMGDLQYVELGSWLATWLGVAYLVVKGIKASRRMRAQEKVEQEKTQVTIEKKEI